MESSIMKNMVIIKNLPSNIVDEAIVILKPNVKIKKTQTIKSVREKNSSKELILKEAEHIISEYVDRISAKENERIKLELEKKVKKLKIIIAMFFVILVIMAIIK